MKPPRFKKLVDEYYFEESEIRVHNFSDKGDSGAGVISRLGKLVRFVMAGATVDDMQVVVHPNSALPDLKGLRRVRGEDSMDRGGRRGLTASQI